MESMGTGITDSVIAEGDYPVVQTRGARQKD